MTPVTPAPPTARGVLFCSTLRWFTLHLLAAVLTLTVGFSTGWGLSSHLPVPFPSPGHYLDRTATELEVFVDWEGFIPIEMPDPTASPPSGWPGIMFRGPAPSEPDCPDDGCVHGCTLRSNREELVGAHFENWELQGRFSEIRAKALEVARAAYAGTKVNVIDHPDSARYGVRVRIVHDWAPRPGATGVMPCPQWAYGDPGMVWPSTLVRIPGVNTIDRLGTAIGNVIAHEVGHALGFMHEPLPGHLMSAGESGPWHTPWEW